MSTATASPSVSPVSAVAPRVPLIEVNDLYTWFPVRRGFFRSTVGHVRAVDGVSFALKPGETLGLVGESGCGKSTVGRTILKLIPATRGQVRFLGEDVLGASPGRMRQLRREMQIIFQDPAGSLNPRMTVAEIIAEPMRVHGTHSGSELDDRVAWLLKKVGLTAEHGERYPHAFSGGQRQRIGIARALALNPKLIVCDEPVSALDVSVQSQVLNLMKDLQEEFGLSYLFIAHNLAVVEHFCDRIAVMYLGRIVELASRDALYANPLHPYTRALLSAAPMPDPSAARRRIMLLGDVPSPIVIDKEDLTSKLAAMRKAEQAEQQAAQMDGIEFITRSSLLHRPGLREVPGDAGHFVSCDGFDAAGKPQFNS